MKKFLSIILAVVMIASLLPATFMTAAAAEPTDLAYVFSHEAHTTTAANKGNALTYLKDVGFDNMDTSVSSGAWGNKGHRTGADDVATAAMQNVGVQSSFGVHKTANVLNLTFPIANVNSEDGYYYYNSYKSGSEYPVFIITIDVPVAGKYIPAVKGNKYRGQMFDVFLVKETNENKDMTATQIRNNLKPADRIGSYDSSVGGKQAFIEHYLEKGVYYLTFIPSGRGASSGATPDSEVAIQLVSFHLDVPEKVETYDPAKLGGDGKLYYDFALNSFNVANSITDSETGEKTYYFGNTAADITAYYTKLQEKDPSVTLPNVAKLGAVNTWTDMSAAAQAAGKYIPWSTTSGRATNIWFREVNGVSYIYHGDGGFWENSYDYLNLSKTDKWAYVKKMYDSKIGDKNQAYSNKGTAGMHHQFYEKGMKTLDETKSHVAIKVNIPTPAKYKFDLVAAAGTAKGLHLATYFAPISTTLPLSAADRESYRIIKDIAFTKASTDVTGTATIDVETSGDYLVVFEFYKDANSTFDPTEYPTVSQCPLFSTWIKNLTLTFVEEIPEKVTAEVAAKRAAMVLDEGNPNAEAVSAGAATVNVLARAIDEDDHDIDSVIGTVANVATGAAYTTEEAPEIPGYKFLYWGVGLGTNMRVVSTEETATIKAAKGANYVYAFYSKDEEEDVTVEFYNANRELLKRTPYVAGDKIEIPDLPSLTGVGDAIAWSMDGGKTPVVPGDEIIADGPIMAFFAVYNEEAIAKDITIKTSGSTGITGEGTFAFGDVVTLTAPMFKNGTEYNMFLYWKKGDEIVSFDRVYKFNAAVDCNVEAVYAKYGPTSVEALRKIIVSTVGEAVVAEFIGCENALERGFIFGDLRQPMMTDAKSFTMINDTVSIPKAYAIFADGVIYSK